ncbi:MAG: hypothetical protein JW910_04420 [Anaerolineae bacterium]|nr:hypothetical protein [Anaerolineae bacterium]
MEAFLQLSNEALTAIIVIVSASILLYNLTRNLKSSVTRASSVLLACVTVVFTVDALTSLNPTRASLETWLRVQWIGIAFSPAAMFHLSHSLLATTGLESRGRRIRIARMLYIFSALFLVMAAFSDALVYGLVHDPAPHLLAGPVFPLYVVFFLLAVIVSVYNVVRARNRCLTTYTRRRMNYLLFSFTMPALGIFPYSLLFSEPGQLSLFFWLLVNLSNLGIALMLIFMAYPLSFFGSSIPDRVVKTELLSFFLRGPFVGSLVLILILYLPQAGRILGLEAEDFVPFAAVGLVMFWQWMVSLAMPRLERYLVYANDQHEMRMVQSVSQRLVTQSDLRQLLEAILAASCDLLRVPDAFLAVIEGEQAAIEQRVGEWTPARAGDAWDDGKAIVQLLKDQAADDGAIVVWEEFWLVPLYSHRVSDTNNGAHRLLGALGVRAPAAEAALPDEEAKIFSALVRQAAQALDDRLLQQEVFAALEGLLPEMEAIHRLREASRYGDYSAALALARNGAQLELGTDEFVNAVRDALRDYWGGPRLTRSPLLELSAVRAALADHDENPARALRAVLVDVVNRLRPAGERSMTRAEWTLYNIIELRFIQGYKVRDVARRLAMSEADLYRKQRVAIEEVALALADLERDMQQQ